MRIPLLFLLTVCMAVAAKAQQADTTVASTHDIGSVAVTAGRTTASGIATRTALERLPALLGERDVVKYLATLPGVATTSALDASFYVRGGGGSENACYLNGSPIQSPEHLTGILATFDPFVLGRATLYKSGFPARYNGALASYLLLQPAKAAETPFSGEAEAGVLSSAFRMRFAGKGGAVVSASARLSYLQYLTRLYNRIDSESDIPDYTFSDYTASAYVPLGRGWTAEAFGLYSSDRLSMDRGAFPLRWHTYSANVRFGWRNDRGHAALKAAIRGKGGRGETQQQVVTAYDDRNRFLTAGIESGWHLGNAWELSAGVDFEHATLATVYNGQRAAGAYRLWSGWAALEGRIAGELYLMAGLHAQHYEGLDNQTVWSPRLRLRYAPGRWNFWADYARTAQFTALLPVLNSRSPLDILRPLDAGQPPALCDQWSVGAEVEAGVAWYFYGALFYKKMRHAKEFAQRLLSAEVELEGLQINGEGAARGLELDAVYDRGPWYVRANYTLSDSWRRFDAINDGCKFRPPFDIRHNVLLVLAWQPAARWRLSAQWSYQSGTYTTFPVGVAVAQDIHNPQANPLFVPVYRERYNFQMPATHRLDLDVAYTRPRQRISLTVHAGLYNTYNRANPSYVQFRIETRDTYYTRFIPRARVLLPLIPYLSLSLQW